MLHEGCDRPFLCTLRKIILSYIVFCGDDLPFVVFCSEFSSVGRLINVLPPFLRHGSACKKNVCLSKTVRLRFNAFLKAMAALGGPFMLGEIMGFQVQLQFDEDVFSSNEAGRERCLPYEALSGAFNRLLP